MAELIMQDETSVASPSSGKHKLYPKSNGWYSKDSAGNERAIDIPSAFSADKSAESSNVTGDNTIYTVICDREISDPGANYNNSTGKYTALFTGLHLFTLAVLLRQINTTLHTELDVILKVTGTSSANYVFPKADLVSGVTDVFLSYSVFVFMTAGDTAEMQVTGYGSSKVIDVYGGTSISHTRFAGAFLG